MYNNFWTTKKNEYKSSTILKFVLNDKKAKHMFFGMEGIIIFNWKHFIPPVHQVQLTNIACVLYTNKTRTIDFYRQKQVKFVRNSKRSPFLYVSFTRQILFTAF